MDFNEFFAVFLLILLALNYCLNKLVLKRQEQQRDRDGDGTWL